MPRMKRKSITSDEYLIRIVCYIHHNPVHHGLTKDMSEWPHSSFSAFLSKEPAGKLKGEVLRWFDGLENFLYCHEESLETKLLRDLEGF